MAQMFTSEVARNGQNLLQDTFNKWYIKQTLKLCYSLSQSIRSQTGGSEPKVRLNLVTELPSVIPQCQPQAESSVGVLHVEDSQLICNSIGSEMEVKNAIETYLCMCVCGRISFKDYIISLKGPGMTKQNRLYQPLCNEFVFLPTLLPSFYFEVFQMYRRVEKPARWTQAYPLFWYNN